MPFGLISSEQISGFWSQNTRRDVFYSYPNGTAPLMGFLSLADTKDTPHPEFGWNEKRWIQKKTLTIEGADANTVFYVTGGASTAGTTFTPTLGVTYRIFLAAPRTFQPDDVLSIHGLIIDSTGRSIEATFRVVEVGATWVEAMCLMTLDNDVRNNVAAVVGIPVIHAGSAFAEASRSRTGSYTFPAEIFNYTGIEKTAWEMSGTALKEPLKYDKTGTYSDMLKENGINHMAGMEWKAFFSNRWKDTQDDSDTGQTVSVRQPGGLLWFLKQWELGNTGDGGAFNYRPAGNDVSNRTDFNLYPDKRIIRLGGGAVTKTQFNRIEALPFRKTNSTEWCKLCLAGSNYIAMVNEIYERQVQKTEMRGEQFSGWNFEVTERQGVAGKIYYKNHPLFNDGPMVNSAFYIDLGYIKYRPLTDRDTDVQPMIQANDADKRKDQYLTEWSLELPYPEAHMYVEGLGGITLG